MARILFVPIMCSALNNFNPAALNTINNTVVLVYMSTPIPFQISSKWLWLANSGIAVSVNILKKDIDTLQCFLSCVCQYR